ANPTFVPIGFDDDSDFGDSAISIFTSHGYFALTFNDRHDPEYYIAVSRGTFDAQSITLDDVSAADKLGMKYSDERVNTSWYRVTMYNTEGFFEEPVKLEAFISYANDDDIVFYWPIREGMPKAEISFVRRTSDALR
ncbi:MAG: hypothetical protein FWE48_05910, partial [Coriobacteriia bacterium]|nr:hypothetical protein [Coriobacteriia bacterium]